MWFARALSFLFYGPAWLTFLAMGAAARQLDRDRKATNWKPDLLKRKHARTAASAFAYLRGAAPLGEALRAFALHEGCGVPAERFTGALKQ